MNCQELMLGDWIRFSSEPYNFDDALRGKPVRVEGLRDEDGAIKVYERDIYYWSEDEDDFEPIPLTPEILEKNFSSTPEWYFEGTTGYCLRIGAYKNAWCLYYERGRKVLNLQVKIDFVHELQHVLQLCGISKEIIL